MMDPDDGGNTGKIRAEGGNGIRANPIPYQGGAAGSNFAERNPVRDPGKFAQAEGE